VTFQEKPPMATMLYAKVIPDHGGDTLFANQYLAYDTLSDGMKEMLDGMIAVHSAKLVYSDTTGQYNKNYQEGHKGTKFKLDEEADALVEHPVVRTHPETGRKALYNFALSDIHLTTNREHSVYRPQ
jgi:taurine dioxygenase